MGPERVQQKLQHNDETERVWSERAANAPPQVVGATYDFATQKFLLQADRLESKGKTLFVKDYPAFIMKHDVVLSAIRSTETFVTGNPTCIPDEVLKTFTPIILIKHPALVIPSWLRGVNSEGCCHAVEDEDVTVFTSARWSRILFDYFRGSRSRYQQRGPQKPCLKRHNSHAGGVPSVGVPSVVATQPLVIDAADVVHNTHATVSTLCRVLGVDLGDVHQTPTKDFQRSNSNAEAGAPKNNILKAFSGRLSSSEDVDQRRSRGYNINLDAETAKWRVEFGDDVAQSLRQKVEEEMPHYEYLRKFKLRARPSLTEAIYRENVTGIPAEIRSAIDKTVENSPLLPRSPMGKSAVERSTIVGGEALFGGGR